MTVDGYSGLHASTKCWRTSELEEMGVSRRRIPQLLKGGVLARIQVNAFVAARYWNSLSETQKARFRITAHAHASRALGPATYSHISAARVHGLSLWGADAQVHVTHSSAGSSREHIGDVVRHRASLLPRDLDMVDGLRITSLARTVVDCARMLPYRQGLIVADQALRRGVKRAELWEVAQGQKGFKGVQVARKVIENGSPLSESPDETLTWHLLAGMPLPLPEQQVTVCTRLGEHRLDFAWREQKIALEFDGRTKYFDYAPTPDVLFQERRREKALMEEGWIFIRLEWADLFAEGTRARIQKVWWNRTKSAA